MIKQKVFLVGMPRSGTTSLMKLLNSHKDIVSFGESLFFGRQYLKPSEGEFYVREEITLLYKFYLNYNWINKFSDTQKQIYKELITKKYKELLLNDKITPKFFFDTLCKVFEFTFNKKFSIEKTPHHIHFIDRVKGHYPDSKFIITYRNPYDFMLSYKFQGSQTNEEVRRKFEKTYHPLQVALIWRKYINSITKYKALTNTLLLDIETLEGYGLYKLAKFLNIEKEDLEILKKDNSSFSKMKVKPKLDKIDIFWVNLLLKKYLKENAVYQDSNYGFWAICKSVFKIPLALFYNLHYLEIAKGQTKLNYLFNYLKITKNND